MVIGTEKWVEGRLVLNLAFSDLAYMDSSGRHCMAFVLC
jgi:hypothetical protein